MGFGILDFGIWFGFGLGVAIIIYVVNKLKIYPVPSKGFIQNQSSMIEYFCINLQGYITIDY